MTEQTEQTERAEQTIGARWIRDKVRSGAPFLAGKLGTSELDILYFYMGYRLPSTLTDRKLAYPMSMRKNICVNAGVFPATDASLDEWSAYMLSDVLPSLDCVAKWNPANPLEEEGVLRRTCPAAFRCKLRSLEPYYEEAVEDRWSVALPARVAVVSPFASSIVRQWARREDVWKHRTLWNARTDLFPVRCGYNPILAGSENAWDVPTWREAVAKMVEAVVDTGATVALIGCGALSLPIGAELKRRGVSAIHTGGATQILFGIKGRRWLTHSVISTFFNEAWVLPSAEEVPSQAVVVEGGCYW
jgi:hypothetical protein